MRPIDADALIRAINQTCSLKVVSLDNLACIIEKQPTIDAVPVVRCKDCVSFHYSGMGGDDGITYCAKGIEMQPTDFCSYGERKDDEC